MRILYCNKYNFLFSGTEVYLFELMEMMRAHGHQAILFSMADPRGEPTPCDSHFIRHIDFKSANPRVQKFRHAVHALYSREARRKIRGLIEVIQPDVAHVRNIYHHLSPSILWELKAQNVPVVYHLNDFKLLCPSYNLVAHGRVCERCRGGKFWHVLTAGCYQGPPGAPFVLAAEAYLHKWLRTYRSCVDGFIAPSRFVKKKFVEYGWPQEGIEVLPHFQKLPSQIPSVPGPEAHILYFGRLSSEKGVDDLLHAMAHLPDLRLVVAGDGPQREQLQHLAAELQLNRVEFTGQLRKEQLESLIAASRFTVFPSHAYETMGKSILESYAWGRAVVASDLGSRRELVHEGETGMLFPPGDVRQLAAALTFLARQPELAERMGMRGRAMVGQYYSPEDHYRSLLRIYEGLSSPRRNQSRSENTVYNA
ncbi:MAG TPA: glycosyltransferase family 4 protein [Terriglobales bacterium]|nr:glycosyltransferase family 4 protein [Terriglobales bacterium]